MISKDFTLVSWWIRKHDHRIRIVVASWVMIGALIAGAALLAWLWID